MRFVSRNPKCLAKKETMGISNPTLSKYEYPQTKNQVRHLEDSKTEIAINLSENFNSSPAIKDYNNDIASIAEIIHSSNISNKSVFMEEQYIIKDRKTLDKHLSHLPNVSNLVDNINAKCVSGTKPLPYLDHRERKLQYDIQVFMTDYYNPTPTLESILFDIQNELPNTIQSNSQPFNSQSKSWQMIKKVFLIIITCGNHPS